MAGLMVNHNRIGMNTQRHLGISNRGLAVRIERLSSGLRINRAADDASGLSISEMMRAEIGGMRVGTRNAEQGANLIQTAEGALNEVSSMLIRMRELSVQAATSTVNDNNRDAINAEFTQLVSEIDRIAQSTSYNDTSILSGFGNVVSQNATTSTALASTTTGVVDVQISAAASGTYVFTDGTGDNEITLGNGVTTQTIDLGVALDADVGGAVVATGSSIVASFDRLGVQLILSGQRNASSFDPASDGYRDGDLNGTQILIEGGVSGTIQVGADAIATDRIELNIDDMSASGARLSMAGVSLSTIEGARNAISSIDQAINIVSTTRLDLGVQQNRLQHTIRNNNVSIENIEASESIIRDADVAEEVTQFTRSQVLTQSGTALLAQANAIPQSALTLLQ